MYPSTSLTINSGVNLDVCGDIYNEGYNQRPNGLQSYVCGSGNVGIHSGCYGPADYNHHWSPFADVAIKQSQPMTDGVSLLVMQPSTERWRSAATTG
jgi:hypothetical protein